MTTIHDTRRRTLLATLGSIALMTPAGAFAAARSYVRLPKVGEVMRLPDAPLIGGGEFRAADVEGKVTLVYWWASWCPFCALQSPHIQKLWETQQPRGLTMLGISIDKRVDEPRAYLAKKGYTFPSTLDGPRVSKVLPKPGDAIPVTCVRGRDGRVLFAEMGQMFPEDVEGLARFV